MLWMDKSIRRAGLWGTQISAPEAGSMAGSLKRGTNPPCLQKWLSEGKGSFTAEAWSQAHIQAGSWEEGGEQDMGRSNLFGCKLSTWHPDVCYLGIHRHLCGVLAQACEWGGYRYCDLNSRWLETLHSCNCETKFLTLHRFGAILSTWPKIDKLWDHRQ